AGSKAGSVELGRSRSDTSLQRFRPRQHALGPVGVHPREGYGPAWATRGGGWGSTVGADARIAVPLARSSQRTCSIRNRSHNGSPAAGKNVFSTDTFTSPAAVRTVIRLYDPSGSFTTTVAGTRSGPGAVSTSMPSARIPSVTSRPARSCASADVTGKAP